MAISIPFFDHIKEMSQLLECSPDIYVVGDVNLDHLPKSMNETTSNLITLLKSFGLSQYIKDPTRVTANTKTLLDVMYIKTTKKINTFVIKTSLSDHFLVGSTRSLDYHKPVNKSILGRSYKNYSFERTKQYYSRQRRDLIYQLDVNLAWTVIQKYITNCANVLCPMRQIQIRQDPSPWITSEIVEQLNDRDKAFELAQKVLGGTK